MFKTQPISFGIGFNPNHLHQDKNAKDNFGISLRKHNLDVNNLDENRL